MLACCCSTRSPAVLLILRFHATTCTEGKWSRFPAASSEAPPAPSPSLSTATQEIAFTATQETQQYRSSSHPYTFSVPSVWERVKKDGALGDSKPVQRFACYKPSFISLTPTNIYGIWHSMSMQSWVSLGSAINPSSQAANAIPVMDLWVILLHSELFDICLTSAEQRRSLHFAPACARNIGMQSSGP